MTKPVVEQGFAIILLIAALLGGTIGTLLTNALLADLFKQHIEASMPAVAVCGLTIFLIGLMTVTGTVYHAAMRNPEDTLKSVSDRGVNDEVIFNHGPSFSFRVK